MARVQTSERQHPPRSPRHRSTKRRLARVVAALTAGAAVIAAAGLTVANAGAQESPEAAQAWNLAWSDEFNGANGSQPSTADWIYDIGHGYPGGPGNWGTGEIAAHTNSPANVSMDGNGNLEITALRDSAGQWTSARIETVRADFKPPSGGTLKVEGRLQLPQVAGEAALGYWPAFWSMGAPFRGNHWNWPGIGEIDFMENVNGLDWTFGTLHCGVAPGGPCNEFNGLAGQTYCGGSCHSGFHTYGMEWDESGAAGQLRWYVDGTLFHTIDEGDLPADTWAQMTDHAGYFLLLNLAIGGAFPDGVSGRTTPTAATVPGHSMLVDYVRVYTAAGDGTGNPTDPPTTVDPTDPPGDGIDAYSPIQAEAHVDQSGTGTENTADTGGGQNVAWIGNGDWLRFDDVDFGSQRPIDFVARVASGAGGSVSGLVEVRVDSRTSAPIGSFAIANTGGWQQWRTVPANVSGVTGVHDVYLTFTSGQPNDFVNLNWFHFRH
ncbi:glycoside hydrolase family 16 protein [Glycomyces algeriensis]|uniref:Endo-1,3-beta-glucanase n=1 Tax=Glycomyces algeriensis TaxID=256037 RepID=A0A9W6G951_9ACTN|nr:glycoside hydrolase family 16 protein [Glycomyces algeriensis]MDA1367449.1 glycoside hydrolase family 16 protein [Glycomyces algeriensis]MDR7350896.1 beta-glucanase (GH16 family) [Glycomyces algeriensis]GLI43609.1 endo-1,3-beta-glucanase [Glycomyces algeriensis]